MRLDLFLLGFAEYAVPEESAAEVFEAMRRVGAYPKAVRRCEKKGEIRFFGTLRAMRTFSVESPACRELRRGGLPVLFAELWRRPGLLLGCLLALALTVGARLVLWDIEIEGNERIGDDELLGELAAVGLSRGCYLPRLDGEEMALALRRGDGRIAYAAVNLRGTVARVQIREAVVPPIPVTAPADLVAATDGVVVLPLAFEGEVLVREGDVVRAGQILVSGTIQGGEGSLRLTRAAGQVLARTVHTYEVNAPLAYSEKVYTGRRFYDVDLIFFGFRGKVFKNSRNLPITCDIIQNINMLTLPGGRALPFGVAVTAFLPFDRHEAARAVTEARALAMTELEARIAKDGAVRTVLSRTVETVSDGAGVRLLCTLVCEENIAVVRELEEIPNELG